MSDMPPDLRDGNLSSVYRATPPDEPPAALNDAIRAAARREVGARPRAAGKAFFSRWQMPFSVAAVLVLCVSLIAVMRDEGGELTQVPRADAPPAASVADRSAQDASVVPKVELAPETAQSRNIGLKQPAYSANAPAAGADPYSLVTPGGGTGMRASGVPSQERNRVAEPAVTDALPRRAAPPTMTEKADVALAAPVANNAAKSNARPDAPVEVSQASGPGESRGSAQTNLAPAAPVGKLASTVESGKTMRQQPAIADQMERDARVAAPFESQAVVRPASPPVAAQPRAESAAAPAPAPAAKIAGVPAVRMPEKSVKESSGLVEEMARMPPDKWIARIEELRQSGRLEDARAGLAEFRKRYPDYALPASLRDGIQR